MKKNTITLEDHLYEFYRKIGESAGGIQVEQVLADALFQLLGELLANTQQQEVGGGNYRF